jgi:diadenosine tetraphosphate (Ap4A) HIT family hydrolase
MSKWNNPPIWQALLDGSGCPICTRGLPLHVIANLKCSWLTMSEEAPMLGYVCLVSQVHVVELHELEEAGAEAFMRDIRSVSKALSIATGAVKLNYDIHGNTLPHLHMHFFPRYVGDPFEGKAIEPRTVTQPVYAPGQFAEVKSRLLAALAVGSE